MTPFELSRKTSLRIAGVMSGTSADGVDVAVIDMPRRGALRVLTACHVPYPPEVRRAIFELFDPRTATVDRICRMNFTLGELFAKAVILAARRGRLPLRSIDLIGSHGQTVWHAPPGSTLQIGEPSVIAERTGITTVADFRPRDVAAGGHGAPLVPLADWLLLRHRARNRTVQNIGGIANVTYLPAGAAIDDVLAFDTGPGNMMIDRAASLATAGKATYDKDGRLAAAGTPDPALLAQLMRHPYLRRRPPKTTGREEFGIQLTDDLWRRHARRHRPKDFVAAMTAFTARSIAQAYRRFLARVDEVVLCGGGARNPTLVSMLRRELESPGCRRRGVPSARVLVLDELGIAVETKEAVSFAVLAARTIRNQPGNVPSATGASNSVVLGKIVPGRHFA